MLRRAHESGVESAELRNYPCMIVSDNGTELTSNAILAWQQERGVGPKR